MQNETLAKITLNGINVLTTNKMTTRYCTHHYAKKIFFLRIAVGYTPCTYAKKNLV